MIAALKDFTPKDYEKVMAEVNKAHIELVDKLSKEDIESRKTKKDNNKAADIQPAQEKATCETNPIIAKSHEEDLTSITIPTGDALDEPTAEELNLINEDAAESDTEEIIEEAEMEDYQNDDDRERDDSDEESYLEDGIIPAAYTDDPIRMYLKEIGNFGLISGEDEIKLAKRINKGRAAILITQGEECPDNGIDYSEWSDEEIIKKFNEDIKKEKEITGQRSIAKLLSRLKRRKARGNPYTLDEYKKAAAKLTKAEHKRLLKFAQDDNCYIEGMEEVDVDTHDFQKEVAYLFQLKSLMDEIELRELQDIGGFTVAESKAL